MRFAAFLLLTLLTSRAADFRPAFEQANRLYEQRRYAEAAAAYQELLRQGAVLPVVYFNLGNAWFKAGETGRAIAAYREAEHLAPRDPDVRYNLQFARKKVTGSDVRTGGSFLNNLTLNEWTWIALAAYWLLFLLLSLREIRPGWRVSLRGASILAGGAFVLAAALLIAAYRAPSTSAVVVSPNAVVRYGPLEESEVFYQLRDGSELLVLDEKRTTENQVWLQVRDASRRVGWLKQQEVIRIGRDNASTGTSRPTLTQNATATKSNI